MKTEELSNLLDENHALRQAVKLLRAAKATRDPGIAERLELLAADALEQSKMKSEAATPN